MNLSLTIPNSKRIAWAWLDNLLEKSEKEQRPLQHGRPVEEFPVLQLTMREREKAIERAYEQTKSMLIKAIGDEIGNIQHGEAHFARQAGLDPLYFNWFIVNGQSWPRMPQEIDRALRAIQHSYLWYGAVPDHWNNMWVPDLELSKHRDHALQEFGRWVIQQIVPKVERKYVREVWKQSQDLVKQFRGKNAPRDAVAAIMLMKDFKKRLIGDRFQLKPAVHRFVDLFE